MKFMSHLAPKGFSYIYRSVATKIIFIVLILVLPLNIFGIIISNMALQNVKEQTQNSVINVMENYVTDVEERMNHIVTSLYSMRTSQTDGLIVSAQKGDYEYDEAKARLYHSVQTILSMSQTADGAFIYMNALNDMIQWTLNTEYHSQSTLKEYIQKLMNEETAVGWHFFIVPGRETQISEYPMLWLITKQKGICTGGWIELSKIKEKICNDLQYNDVDVTFTQTDITDFDKEKFVISKYFEPADVYMTVTLNGREINGTILSLYLFMRNFALADLVMIPFLYYFLFKLMILPIWNINKAHRELEQGNSDYRITKHSKSVEYREAYDSFNKMADNILNLKVANYEKELEKQSLQLEKKDIELQNLQLQIRPHFLLNSFNLIYNLAQEKDVEHIQEVMLYLSDYFRYIFRSNHDRELFTHEQKLIEGYINMAQIRYPESIFIHYDYDPEISFVRVPPLLIHNFIENIVKHVVKQGKKTHIELWGRYDESMVTFFIMDDGPGIEKEKVEEINAKMKANQKENSHVGMANAYHRLIYLYGTDADIEFQSELGIGTTVIIRFPYNLEFDESKV